MNIAVVRPSMFGRPAADRMMPLLFAILKPLTPAPFWPVFYDERVRPLPARFEEPVVAITVETFAAKRAYQLADQCLAEGKTVLLGGFHPTMLPEEAAAHASAVLCGDAEATWPAALEDLGAGALKPLYRAGPAAGLAGVRYDYSVFPKKDYPLVAPVQFGRGCQYHCDFCSIHAFYGSSIRFRPVEEVVGDIRRLPQRYLFFIDDNLFADEGQAVRLFRALRPLKKKWVCQISMEVAKNPALLRLMRQSGCIMVIMGFESLDAENLRRMGKSANLGADYEAVVQNLYKAGIMIYGTFVIGYDADTAHTAGRLMEFALQHKFAIANFNPLMPMPGTALYGRLQRQGRLPYGAWWLDEDYRYGDAMLRPAAMGEEELLQSCRDARFRFNAPHNLLWRATNLKANLRSPARALAFLAAGLVSRKEIHAKQGRKLGEEF